MPIGPQGAMASTHPIPQPSHRGAPVQNSLHNQAASPPSREQLRSWWSKFGRRKDKPEEQFSFNQGIFGVPLDTSIKYANVAISLTNEQGESFIYGYVPIVVAKCGVFLKEKATDVEGIFRLSGSAKRIKDLQNVFNSPERYGKGLDWNGYTVHDAANILRRYLNQLPEPIVPLDFYEKFRDPLRDYQAKVDNGTQPQIMENEEHARAVASYQRLITQLPHLNRQLLLYILDLLAVFASKSDLNRMTAQNLAAIFQPGIISHPAHDMAPSEYRLSQDVLIFLIENQDNFLIGMTGTAMDEKSKDEVTGSGPPSMHAPKAAIGRSASSASAGSSSVRRTAVIRRNGSLSSRNSRDRQSPNVSIPGTPVTPSALGTAGATGSIGRSNTVPSKRSPAITAHRFQNVTDSSQTDASPSDTGATVQPAPSQPPTTSSTRGLVQNTDVRLAAPETGHSSTKAGPAVIEDNTVPESIASTHAAQELKPVQDNITTTGRQNRERKVSNLLTKSPKFGPSDGQRDPQQKPRKLQKRRIPGSSNESAQSSQASLQGDEAAAFHTPMATPLNLQHDRQNPIENNNNTTERPGGTPVREGRNQGRSLVPPHGSPTPSQQSRGSATETSDFDALDDGAVRSERSRNIFRRTNKDLSPLEPPPSMGQMAGARTSNTSLGSHKPRKSFTGDSQMTQSSTLDSTGQPASMNVSSRESGELLSPSAGDSEKRGFLSRMKAKLGQSKEAREEKERAKSPPRLHADHSRSSLSAFAAEHLSPRGRSFDKQRDEAPSGLAAPVGQERSGSRTLSASAQPGMPSSSNAAPVPVSVQSANEQQLQPSTMPIGMPAMSNPIAQQSQAPEQQQTEAVKAVAQNAATENSAANMTGGISQEQSSYPAQVVSELAAINTASRANEVQAEQQGQMQK